MSSINQCMSCSRSTSACHVLNQPMHVMLSINQCMSSINQCMSSTNQCMPSTNQCMSPINQCMSCYQSTNACHVVGQALTVIIIVSQQNAVPVPALCKLEGNRLWNNLEFPAQTVWSTYRLLKIYTLTVMLHRLFGTSYTLVFFFLYPFLTGHYKR